MIPFGFKTCSTCKETKPTDDFAFRDWAEDGLAPYCRRCGAPAHEVPQPRDYWVYKAFDAEGELLYVGQTACNWQRLGEHRQRREWSRRVARIEIEHFDNPKDTSVRERALIEEWLPRYNQVFKRTYEGFAALVEVRDKQKVEDQ